MKLKYKIPLMITIASIIILMFFGVIILDFNKTIILPYIRTNAIDKINAEIASLEASIDMGIAKIRTRTKLDAAKNMDFEGLKPFLNLAVDSGHFHKIALVFPDREYYKEIFSEGPIVTPLIHSTFDDSYIIVITMPITDNNQTVGALMGAIPAKNIEEIIFNLSINNAGYGFLSI
ncbi:MAG: hypothetical protein ACLKAK_02340 [Alkaliphilus sp.]